MYLSLTTMDFVLSSLLTAVIIGVRVMHKILTPPETGLNSISDSTNEDEVFDLVDLSTDSLETIAEFGDGDVVAGIPELPGPTSKRRPRRRSTRTLTHDDAVRTQLKRIRSAVDSRSASPPRKRARVAHDVSQKGTQAD